MGKKKGRSGTQLNTLVEFRCQAEPLHDIFFYTIVKVPSILLGIVRSGRHYSSVIHRDIRFGVRLAPSRPKSLGNVRF
jgi:hypothetical protein